MHHLNVWFLRLGDRISALGEPSGLDRALFVVALLTLLGAIGALIVAVRARGVAKQALSDTKDIADRQFKLSDEQGKIMEEQRDAMKEMNVNMAKQIKLSVWKYGAETRMFKMDNYSRKLSELVVKGIAADAKADRSTDLQVKKDMEKISDDLEKEYNSTEKEAKACADEYNLYLSKVPPELKDEF